MSGPRDPHTPGDPFGDRPEQGDRWQEPAHLGDDGERSRREQTPESEPWVPPGWNAPEATEPAAAATPESPVGERPADAQWPPPEGPPSGAAGAPAGPPLGARPGAPPGPGGLFGPRRPRTPGIAEQVFRNEGDLLGVQAWAMQRGWEISDGTAPGDAVLAELIAAAPLMRLSKEHRPAGVLRGRYGSLEMVAFDVVYFSGRYAVPQYAVTAVPLLGAVPRFRLSPARFWKHRVGGMVPLPSGNEAFDLRWSLLAAEDSPQLHRLVQDRDVQALLLGTDDGDEFWSAAGHVAAVRPDGHRPQLLEHHARLLSALVGALGAG